ncbi:hypothetical protein E2C01_067978 [Portunus trituberculatus]|uniref:Uncharacterized protein n=1 Tax=Portunus trituberculatus TaxID=210409 RepID=A0A5B7HQT1_PORTR|nr:hypothetical protein [Portunus trituberculatus]
MPKLAERPIILPHGDSSPWTACRGPCVVVPISYTSDYTHTNLASSSHLPHALLSSVQHEASGSSSVSPQDHMHIQDSIMLSSIADTASQRCHNTASHVLGINCRRHVDLVLSLKRY